MISLFYAWNMWSDEIKIFRYEVARDTFVASDTGSDWRAVSVEDLGI